MSFNNPMPASNPAKIFLEWSGEKNGLSYYDKDKKERLAAPDKIRFIILDELSTIKGYSSESSSGIYSNEVHSIAKEQMVVKTFNGKTIATGFYSEIKDKIATKGGKYTKSVYAVIVKEDGTISNGNIINFQFSGSSLSAFINSKVKMDEHLIIEISNTGELIVKSKNVQYYEPVFKKVGVINNSETLRKVRELDNELAKFFKEKRDREKQDNSGNTTNETVTTKDREFDFDNQEAPDINPADFVNGVEMPF